MYEIYLKFKLVNVCFTTLFLFGGLNYVNACPVRAI
jgi:hypothetical protein